MAFFPFRYSNYSIPLGNSRCLTSIALTSNAQDNRPINNSNVLKDYLRWRDWKCKAQKDYAKTLLNSLEICCPHQSNTDPVWLQFHMFTGPSVTIIDNLLCIAMLGFIALKNIFGIIFFYLWIIIVMVKMFKAHLNPKVLEFSCSLIKFRALRWGLIVAMTADAIVIGIQYFLCWLLSLPYTSWWNCQ